MKQILFGITLMVLLFTSLYHIFAGQPWSATAEASALPSYDEIIVKPGDTLWNIADQYNDRYHISVRDMMQRIMDENHIEQPKIYPGETINIPTDIHQ